MTNRMTEDLGQGKFRERDSNSPAVETQNARRVLYGPLRIVDIAAGQNSILLFNGVNGAPAIIPTPFSGRLLGFFGYVAGTINAGSVTITPVKGAAAQDSRAVQISVGNQPKFHRFAVPVEFQGNDSLYFKVVASADLNPSGTLDPFAVAVIEWTPE